ncbi:MAG: electron transfer flavoprotein subunit alpha/FixB family protein [Anaerolineae bacterium]|jgi:electron transfer flavoprotein alpha subunit
MDFSFLDDWTEEEAGPKLAEVGEGYRNIWVAAEIINGALSSATLEAMGQARDLADQIGVYVYGVLLGDGVEALGQKLFAYGADIVLVAEAPALGEYQPETYTQALACLVEQYRPEILLLPATHLGNDLAPRLAQRLNTGLISHCISLSLDMSERLLLGTFPVLGGEMYHTVACPEARPQIATLEPGAFRLPYEDTHRSGDVELVEVNLGEARGWLTWVDLDAEADLPTVPLSKAKVVVSAGRGLQDAAGFALVEQLAEALGGVVAGSRGAYDEGWISEEQIVGVGGKEIAPDLYVACGVSGDVYHTFGFQNAKLVVAINPDEDAPIMKVANVAVVGDAKLVIPALLEALAA